MHRDNNEEKTEQPTNYRLLKAQKKGIGNKYSRELNSILILLMALISFKLYIPNIFFELKKIMFTCFHFNDFNLNDYNYTILMLLNMLKKIFFIFTPIIILLILIIVITPLLFNSKKLNFLSLKFNLTILNPINGLKKIFSLQVIIEFFKTILKVFFIMSVCLFYLWTYMPNILSLLFIDSILDALYFGIHQLFVCSLLSIISMIPVVFFDVIFQYFNYYKNLRMSRQDIRDEFKQIEGDPLIKLRIRQVMKANIQKRMMIDLPQANVIIKNPIHYAVALQYNEKKMNAPKILAKGAGELALKICKIGEQHSIPILSSPALARTLYLYTEIGQYVPSKLYTMVAEVLAWVWKLEKWKKEGGDYPLKPNISFVPDDINYIRENTKDG
ncbi:Flagellar biosynthetic protein FlhB [Buchnera aphidicola (Eriosoma grossulariae)]|uniref:flagellar biosynthesis protein FlhB n=1 Tax=Buchnera aphidicola TaxID=9 RepID=UPI0034639F54